jgi:hypothetical protein
MLLPRRRLASVLLACTPALVLPAPTASACGMFYADTTTLAPESRPSLAREKVLIVHDEARGREHFIREVAFRRADQTFGFVVPTPTLPEVAAVAETPFTQLRELFPFEPKPPPVVETKSGYGRGAGAGFGGGSDEVKVITTEQVGSFTAYTLSATDAGALAKWLADNKLSRTPNADVWLEYYVRMGFYYVAMRYTPPADVRSRKHVGPVAAETIRISFDTPIAYYPYFEPEPEYDRKSARLLEVWYVGSAAVVPVAQFVDPAQPAAAQWVRPLRAGEQASRARSLLAAALPDQLERLLPAGELTVQTFQDQKHRRTGFHDILFAFAEARELVPAQQTALEPLLAALDANLVPEAR